MSSRNHYFMQDQVDGLVASISPFEHTGGSWKLCFKRIAEISALSVAGGICSVILLWQI